MRSLLLSLVSGVVLVAASTSRAAMLAPGAAFPAWDLQDQTGGKVSSHDFAGKTYLLWFYPKAQTPGCTTEGLSLKDHYADFQARGVEIVGVSFDPPADNAAFVERQGFPFRLLSDTDRKLAVAVGAAASPAQPVASRDLAGRTYLLWFYPKAQTPGCTAEGDGLRDRFADFEAAHVEVLGVSFDPPAANKAFVDAERFPFRLLSDTDRTLAVAVGAADTATQPVARRISYLVGPDGTVRAAYGTVVPATHARDVLGDLKAP